MTSNIIPASINEELSIAKYLVTQVIEKASGVKDLECLNNSPKDVYFIGNLRPKSDVDISASQSDLMQKLSPSAFGAEFRVHRNSTFSVNISLEWACYYRVFPTFEQQKRWSLQANDSENSNQQPVRVQNQAREDLFVRFKKIVCKAEGVISFNTDENGCTCDKSDIEKNVLLEFERVNEEIRNDSDSIRLRTAGQQFTIPQQVLEDESRYREFISGLTIPANNNWRWEIAVNMYTDTSSGDVILLFQFINSSPINSSDKTIESYLFNPSVVFNFHKEVVLPFELELAAKSFRYNRDLWGKGFNCGIKFINKIKFKTTNTPLHFQKRYVTNSTPEAKFSELVKDPIKILLEIEKSMVYFTREWEEQEKNYKNIFGTIWESDYKEEYDLDKATFNEEIKKFRNGIKMLQNDSDIYFAFKLTNEVFLRAGVDKSGNIKKQSWRLFQIVFLVSQIPGIAALNSKYSTYVDERKNVDIIYFPTGGGKTEAYLGTLVFHCFYDRLRGKTAGVTSWIRFPLRLLTIQQTQRLADVIGLSEIVRLEQKDKRLCDTSIDKFSVGYYVGAEGTPNKLERPYNGNFSALWSLAKDEKARNAWKRVVSCPSCKTNTIVIDFQEDKVKIVHKCTNKNCRFPNNEIPVYVIDNEIYRYLPTVIVGTIDKLASVGNQRKVSMLFGKIDGYCKEHGYFNEKCCQDDCKDKKLLVKKVPLGLSGPTFFIQDELHLLREGLGTFDSHYETFVQMLSKTLGNDLPLKVIASSATIERYERQVEHLYGMLPERAKVFPGLGPTNQKSFYAETKDYSQRIFIGILPHNKTLFNSVLEIIEYYHRVVQDLAKLKKGDKNPYGGSYLPGEENWNQLLNLYYSSLSYFLSGRELESIRTDIDAHINNAKFKNEGYNPIEVMELTGGTSTDNVTKILELLEQYHSPVDTHEAVLATNMVSHGVDIDRFNCMLFYGIPRQNAEYIQASSRVGRTHVGIVFDCMHPIRERDQSHYSYFTKYHEFLGQLVEPVAINRWSTYGIDKTLPGLFMGVLLQILSNNVATSRNGFYMLKKVSKMYVDGEIDKSEIKRFLKEAYEADHKGDSRNNIFNSKIDKSIDIFFDHIMNQSSNKDFVSEAIYPAPMRSLRDVDEPISIELDSLGSEWAQRK